MPKKLPSSAVPGLTIGAGIAGVLLSLVLLLFMRLGSASAMVLMILMTAIPMWVLEWRRFRVASLVRGSPALTSERRKMALLGGVCVLGLMALSIQLQHMFSGLSNGALPEVTLLLLPVAPLWFAWLAFRHREATQGPDSVEALGGIVRSLVRNRHLGRAGKQQLLAWCVKAFFLPLMLAWLYVWLDSLEAGFREGQGWYAVFTMSMALLYALDTLFATIGYVSTSRSMDAHIRSTDATWLGWVAALACYPPFSGVVLHTWLDYKDGLDWLGWLETPWLKFVWGAAIILLTGIYTSATLVFGPRFSNLTNRGIITAGPFRWTKHPAYISKNLSWWLIAVPFISTQSTAAAVLNCLALLGVNAIYWLRAKTEERHLMADPVYREYAAWVAEYGVVARAKRLVAIRGRT